MLENLTGYIIHLIASAGYPGIFILMVLNASAIPIPSEVTLPFAGFLASTGKLNLLYVTTTAIFADFAGSTIGYLIGYFLEESLLLNLIKKYGKLILLTEHDYIKATSWIKKYGTPVVFIGKLTPGIKSFISVAAGITEIKFTKFALANFLSSLIYIPLVTYFGYYLGSKWSFIGSYFRKFEIVILIFLVVGLAWYVNYKLKIIKLKK